MTGPLHTRLFECMGGAFAWILNPQVLWFEFEKNFAFEGDSWDTIPMETVQ